MGNITTKEDEKVLVMESKYLKCFCKLPGFDTSLGSTLVFDEALQDARWMRRGDVEENESYVQIIPYVVIQKPTGEVLMYQRAAGDSRLTGKWSIGVGGHINEGDVGDEGTDKDYLGIVVDAAEREIEEEFQVQVKDTVIEGVLYLDETPVDRVHLGVVMTATCEDKVHPDPAEIADVAWVHPDVIDEMPLEGWSVMVAKGLFHNEG